MMILTLMIAALVGSVTASSFSMGCINTLIGISSNSDVAACLNPSMLLPILVGAGNGQDSMIAPIDSWVTGMCASKACSSDTISGVVNNLTAGCAAEFNLPSKDQASKTVEVVQKYYATARKVMCLADSSNKLCVTSELGLIQTSVGTVTLSQDNINSIMLLGQFSFTPNITCTDCMHGAVTIINQDLPGVITQDTMQRASSACGASFVDGGIPTGLVQTAVGDTNSSSTPTSTSTGPLSTQITPTSTTYPSPSSSQKSSALGRSLTSLPSLMFTSILMCTLLVTAVC